MAQVVLREMLSNLVVSLCRTNDTLLAFIVQGTEAPFATEFPSSMVFRDFYSEFTKKNLGFFFTDDRILREDISSSVFNQMGHFTYRATVAERLGWIKIESSAGISNICGPRLLKALSFGNSYVTDVNLKLTKDGHLTLFYMLVASSSLANALVLLSVEGRSS